MMLRRLLIASAVAMTAGLSPHYSFAAAPAAGRASSAETPAAADARSTAPAATPTITEHVRNFTALPGLFPLYWDAKKGDLWLEIPQLETEFIYMTSLPGGLGSNDIGLDRGQLGKRRIVRFSRVGPRVLLVQPNLAFRADTTDAAEQQTVMDSFAISVLAGFDIKAEEGGRVLVDATDFFLSDAHDAAGKLKSSGQGTFKLDVKRSAFHLPRTKSFPRNTEVEVMLTFAGDAPGGFVRDVTPDPKSITLRERHSFVALPEPGYVPRVYDPRAGYGSTAYQDYAAPLGEPMEKRFINRHRLEKKNPTAARSEPVEPIIYYLDPGTPEPVRTALLEGARWWNEAFEAAGFIDAYRVELLPPSADPQDVRYNTIQWVHRATRGWSYGSSVIDPRTGEIIKGHVTLGSLRVRHDYLIAEALLAPYEDGRERSPEMEKMALARLRQLSAHEVGHTLGLSHNYLASTAGNTSVMDYPHPFVRIRADRTLDLGDAYTQRIGEWDKVAIACGYTVFPPRTDERAAMNQILQKARERGLTFITDADARPTGSFHPSAHLWDNGANAIDELNRMFEVRAAALARFGENVIPAGRPLATIEEALVPLYLAHRYQIEAAAKLVGGQAYTYALRGDGQAPLAPVPAAEQRRALDALIAGLAPQVLRLPETLVAQLPPRPPGFPATRELFKRRTGLAFDALAPAETAADMICELLFHPQRASRLLQQSARDPQAFGLDELIARVLDATWRQPAGGDYDGEIRRSVNYVVLSRLMTLATDASAAPQVAAVIELRLESLRNWLNGAALQAAAAPAQRAHLAHGARLIERFFEDPKEFTPPRALPAPPGQPI